MFDNLPDNVIPADFYEDEAEEGYTCEECAYFCATPYPKDACLFEAIAEGRISIDWVCSNDDACQLFELK